MEGVYSVNIYGATPRNGNLSTTSRKLAGIGISSSAISASINNYLLEMELGGASETMTGGPEKRTYLTLEGNDAVNIQMGRYSCCKSVGTDHSSYRCCEG